MSLQHMILGLLKYGPVSGYDLNKAFQASVEHFWNTEQSQIYRALYKMQEAGWVEVTHVNQDSLPGKKVYSLTETGREELLRWLVTAQTPASTHEAWLGQLFFAAELSQDQLKFILEERSTALRRLIHHYEHDIPLSASAYAELYHAEHDKAYWLLTLDYGLQKLRFDLQWVESTLANLAQLPERQEE